MDGTPATLTEVRMDLFRTCGSKPAAVIPWLRQVAIGLIARRPALEFV
jgi:hypothetical protein